MSDLQFRCENQKRLSIAAGHPSLNAIDYLEVLDHNAPSGSPPQQTLLVHCLKPIPAFTRDNVRLQGGVRVPVGVEWAARASDIDPALVNPDELAYFTNLPDADRVLAVRTDSSGDYSIYRLSLALSATDSEPPADFDLLLSEVAFSFKVECPSDFDCQPEDICPPEEWPQPQIDYLAKDYASFRRLMLDRLSVIAPDWTERNPADLGTALVETLAYAADYLSYYQDAVATEAYLGTARKRVSVRRHARILDYRMHEGCNARAWVFLEVAAGEPPGGLVVDAGALLVTASALPTGSIDAAAAEAALKDGAQAFETLHALTARAAFNEIDFHTWGDENCCLPRGATRATLKGSAADFPLQAGDALLFEEVRGPQTGAGADADPNHRHVVRLSEAPVERNDVLTGETVQDVAWDPADALPFPLCLWQVDDGLGGTQPVAVARGNIVLVDAGVTVVDEALQATTVPSEEPYRPQLQKTGLTYRVHYDHFSAISRPAAEVTLQDPRRALPAIDLTVTDPATAETASWSPQPDLFQSDRFNRDFVVEVDESLRGHVRFGDDELGRRPPAGHTFTATYRVGNGRAGNAGAETITHIVWPGLENARNPLAAAGGRDPEPLEQVRLYAPQAFRVQERAVTEGDYAKMALRHPEVQKAVATLRWTGSWHTMFVTVDRKGGHPVDADFEAELQAFLSHYRLAGHDLEIEPPQFVPLDIAMTVCVAAGYFRDQVKQALIQAFSSRFLPDGRRSFFHPDNFTFGQPLYLSQVVAVAMQVPGVQWAEMDDTPPKPNRFQRWGKAALGELAEGKIEMGRLEIARLDSDPNAPENGRIEFIMEGGL